MQFKLRFTPGSWRVGFTDSQSIVSDYKHLVLRVGGTAFCDRKHISKAESEANAKLMAASPDMLMALLELIDKAKAVGIDTKKAEFAVSLALDF
jgi:hypothetical protein